MKVSAFAVIAFAVVASAAPIKILVVTHTSVKMPVPDLRVEAPSVFRFGHPAASAAIDPFPPFRQSLSYPTQPTPRPSAHAGGMGCGHHLKAKALSMSNRLRQALGLPPIASTPQHSPHQGGGGINILPFPFPPSDEFVRLHVEMPEEKPFMYRLHRAVNLLGPWEGRAVAFVLGCGLGVLIRMFFVLMVLVVRRARGYPNRQIQLSEEPETTYVILPPSYNAEVMEGHEKSVLILTPEPAPQYVEADVREAQTS